MSALREWAAALGEEAHKAVAVNNLGKWKTATQVSLPGPCLLYCFVCQARKLVDRKRSAAVHLQMVSLSMLLYISKGATDQIGVISAAAGPPLLGVAAALTVWSLIVYMKVMYTLQKAMTAPHPRPVSLFP